ncbi:MAG: hypothetical protein KDA91_16420 [Planctomycetaceae bacterium]|nr:hypothetical protein [Planctomycetaceae bacterium]
MQTVRSANGTRWTYYFHRLLSALSDVHRRIEVYRYRQTELPQSGWVLRGAVADGVSDVVAGRIDDDRATRNGGWWCKSLCTTVS